MLLIALIVVALIALILWQPATLGAVMGGGAGWIAGAIVAFLIFAVNAVMALFPLIVAAGLAFIVLRIWRRRRAGKSAADLQ